MGLSNPQIFLQVLYNHTGTSRLYNATVNEESTRSSEPSLSLRFKITFDTANSGDLYNTQITCYLNSNWVGFASLIVEQTAEYVVIEFQPHSDFEPMPAFSVCCTDTGIY